MKINITLLYVILKTNCYQQTLRNIVVVFLIMLYEADMYAGIHYMNLILYTIKKNLCMVSEVNVVKNKFMAVQIKY